MNTDLNYTSERCLSGLRASEALCQTSGERRYWERHIRFWQKQLEFAMKREGQR